MDKQERDRLRALCDKATAEPWEANSCAVYGPGTPTGRQTIIVVAVRVQGVDPAVAECIAVFIAAARTGLPAALDALDAMEAERDTAKRVATLLGDHTQDGIQLVAALAAAEQKAIDLHAKLDAAEASRDEAVKDMWAWRDTVTTIRRATVEAIVRRLREFTCCSNDWAANLIEREFLEKGGADL